MSIKKQIGKSELKVEFFSLFSGKNELKTHFVPEKMGRTDTENRFENHL